MELAKFFQFVDEIENGCKWRADTNKLEKMCTKGNLRRVQLLINEYDPSEHNFYCFKYAIISHHTAIVEFLLLDPRIDITHDNDWAIRAAFVYQFSDIIKILLPRVTIDRILYNYIQEFIYYFTKSMPYFNYTPINPKILTDLLIEGAYSLDGVFYNENIL